MASRRVEELLFRLGADSRELRRELGIVDRKGKQTASRLERSFRGLSRAILPAAGVAGIAALANQLADATREAVDFFDAIEKGASKLGVTTDFIQELRFAADQSGVGIQTAELAFQRFARRANEAANGSGEARNAIAELGVSLRNVDGTLRRSEDTFRDALEALAGREAQERLRLGFKLFDSEGVVVVNLAGDFDRLAQSARELGVVVDEDIIRGAAEAKGQLDALQQVAGAELRTALVKLAPLLIKVAQAFASVADFAGAAFDRVADFLDLDPIGLKAVNDRLRELSVEINDLQTGLDQTTNQRGLQARGRVNAQARLDRLRDEQRRLNAQRNDLLRRRSDRESLVVPQLPGGGVESTDEESARKSAERVAERARERREQGKRAVAREVEELERLVEALGKSESEYNAVRVAIEAENEARRLGIDLSSEEGQALRQQIVDRERLQEQIDKLTDSSTKQLSAIGQAGKDAAADIAQAFADLAFGADVSFRQIAASFARNILQNEIQAGLTQLLGLGGGQTILGQLLGGGATKTGALSAPRPAVQALSINLVDQVGVNASARETSSPGFGARQVELLLTESTKRSLGTGALDSALQRRFGLKPVGI